MLLPGGSCKHRSRLTVIVRMSQGVTARSTKSDCQARQYVGTGLLSHPPTRMEQLTGDCHARLYGYEQGAYGGWQNFGRHRARLCASRSLNNYQADCQFNVLYLLLRINSKLRYFSQGLSGSEVKKRNTQSLGLKPNVIFGGTLPFSSSGSVPVLSIAFMTASSQAEFPLDRISFLLII